MFEQFRKLQNVDIQNRANECVVLLILREANSTKYWILPFAYLHVLLYQIFINMTQINGLKLIEKEAILLLTKKIYFRSVYIAKNRIH